MLNPDYRDMLSALCEARAEFLLVGAYALAAHGLPRATGDIDIWVRPSPQNARHVWKALAAFGAPLQELKEADVPVLGRADLLKNKRALGRPQDIADVLRLEEEDRGRQ